MFDKLVESKPEGADFKNRRSYFLTSTVVVGILFLTAVVISIYAADYGLGRDGLELTEVLAPVEMTTEPQPIQQRAPQSSSREQSVLPTRQVNMPSVIQSTLVPETTSVVPNTQASAPRGNFEISKVDSDAIGPAGTGRTSTDPAVPEGGFGIPVQTANNDPIPEPPPVAVVKKDPQPVRTVSKRVINGNAMSLPKPNYPVTARAVRAEGKVNVQVLIDEKGRVVSANAVTGHPMLRGEAERAARGAKFTTTYLSNVPVKVTGVIVYNFML